MQMASGPRSTAELSQATTADTTISSLYRTPPIFASGGTLKWEHGPHGGGAGGLAEWLTGHHHHVVCIACGAIEDIEVSDKAESGLHAIVSTLASLAGYRVLDHILEVEGVCEACDD